MPELAVAWVTLAATTRGMEGDIRRAIQRAEGSAKLNPKVNTSGLAAQGSKAGKEFGDRFSSGAKDAMKALAAVSIGAGLVDQFKQVMSVGMDWTNNMNTLQAVTGATADQLQKAGVAARALGNDISLPATSANDAAAAMTELAKGGFTVQQSMTAAKGTLQLAAAAQIGAADAATIQSSALQAFGLQAADAGKISDTLANAANASSAEITDVAQALAQAGTVANQFGLSAQDTASAIALLANNGIKGSDAGTLLKSSLLALTDQGNPAQGAIKQLGLTVYDTQGKFVGLHELFRQLGVASKSMTPEMYQAATATLFGSDAMRLAGVAAKDGSQGYDLMRTAIDRQGAAADVAAAKTRGLPGAWERVKNSIESLQLNTYDSIEGPLTKAADVASTTLGKIPEAFTKLKSNPALQAVGRDTGDAFRELVNAVKGAAPAVGQIAVSLAKASAAVGVGTWQVFVAAVQAAAGVLEAVSPLLSTIAGLMHDNEGAVTAAVAAWLLYKTVPDVLGRVRGAAEPVAGAFSRLTEGAKTATGGVSNFGSAWRTHGEYLRQANPNISTAATNLRTLGSAASGAASGGLSLIKGAAGGLLSAFGGPWGIAIAGATTALGFLAQKHAEAADKARQQIEQEHALQQTLDNSTGVITQATREEVAKRFTTADNGGPTDVQRARSYGLDPNLLVDAATGTGNKQAYDILNQTAVQRGINPGLQSIDTVGNGGAKVTGDSILKDYQKIGISSDDLQKALLRQGTAWQDVSAKIQAADPAGTGTLVSLQRLVDLMPDANESILTLAQNVNEQRRQLDGGTASQKDYAVALNGTWQATQEGVNRFRDLGAAIVAVPDNKTVVVDSLTADAEKKVTDLGYTVTRLPNGQVKVTAETNDALNRIAALVTQVNQPVDMPVQLRILNREALNLPTRTADAPVIVPGGSPTRTAYAFGGISAMAGGALRQISKPRAADIYAGRGAGTIFAEEETGGEAYIPLAPGKRPRSMKILQEVMRRFGVMADGGITVESLKQYASQLSGGRYVRGGPPGPDGTDCSGAQAWMANLLTGGSGRFGTATEGEALQSRGFIQGDPPSGVAAYWIGWKNGGPGGGHTAGTILDPNGGNVNVEMGGANGGGAFGGGAQGASAFPNRAWIQIAGGEDPNAPSSFGGGGSSAAVRTASAGVTSARASVTSAQASLDQANAAVDEAKAKGKSADKIAILEKKRDAAQQRLDAANERQTNADMKLADAKEKAATGSTKEKSGGMDASSLGQSLFGGILQSIGLDGSVFSNPLEWPNVKSGMALANFGGSLLQSAMGGDDQAGGGGLNIGGLNLPSFTNPAGPQATSPVDPNTLTHGEAYGAAPGPVINYTMNGVDPKDGLRKANAHANENYRRSGLPAVRPG